MGWFEERFEEKPGRFKFECLCCSKPMWFPKCKLGKYKLCSDKCRSIEREKEKQFRKRECATCGKIFYPRLVQINNGNGKYCSQKCNTSARAALISEESIRKAIATKRMAENPFHWIKKGPENPNWNGGKDAAKERNKVRQR